MKFLHRTYTYIAQKGKQGFTFVETMVAISVLLIAVVAPMSLAQEGVVAAKLAQDQIVAFYLAQEGIEVVKNIRDENTLSGTDQLSGILNSCVVDPLLPASIGCVVDATTVNVVTGDFFVERCLGSACDPVRTDGNKYGYTTGGGFIDTKYVREIRVWYVEDPTDVGSRKEAIVESIVSWPFFQTTRTYTLRDNLLAW